MRSFFPAAATSTGQVAKASAVNEAIPVGSNALAPTRPGRIQWLRISPFLMMQAGCLLLPLVGWSPAALLVCAGLYALRMFAITAFYHRYFAHRSYQTGRLQQFCFGLLGNLAVQRGPLWWAAHHRKHHKHADQERDSHSPHQHGWFWAHMGWFATAENYRTDLSQVPDLARYPELRWLDRLDFLPPLLLLGGLYLLGAAAPQGWGTSGGQMVVWGFCVSTTVLFHVTSLVNTAGHIFGSRRFATRDRSRNCWWLAFLTFGEGWHNNHHRYPVSVRQGFRAWELDFSYYLIRLMASLGLVHSLRPVPAELRGAGR